MEIKDLRAPSKLLHMREGSRVARSIRYCGRRPRAAAPFLRSKQSRWPAAAFLPVGTYVHAAGIADLAAPWPARERGQGKGSRERGGLEGKAVVADLF